MADQPRLAVESIAGQRPYQEDAVLAETLDDGRVLVAVADGMGGHAAGEVASATALESLLDAIRSGEPLATAFEIANRRVHEKAKEPGKQGMGTTLVAALIDDGTVEWANVGDSRGYVLTSGGIRQLTDDHSFVAEAVKRGQSEAEAMSGPWKDALTRSIGTEGDVEVDTFGPDPLDDQSVLLLCSDGLYKTLTDQDLLRIYASAEEVDAAAEALVRRALESGSDDNISVAIAAYGAIHVAEPGATMPIEFTPDDDPDRTAVQEPVEAAAGVADPPPAAATTGIDRMGDSREVRATGSVPPVVIAVALVAAAAILAFVVFGIG